MANSIGEIVKLTVFGESHGPYIGFSMDGLCAGIKIDEDLIKRDLDLRRPFGSISTTRSEKDEYQIISGFFNGYTTGSTLTVIIPNNDTKSKDYSELKIKPRPSHADYVAEIKYDGYQDYRGGGHFSGRVTTALVIAGSIAKQILEKKGIYIGSHLLKVNSFLDEPLKNTVEEIQMLNNQKIALVDETKEKELIELIEKVKNENDSIGGIIESEIIGMPVGIGEPMFDSVESVLSKLIFSVPAIKGVEFGLGFGFGDKKGSEVNDEFKYHEDKIITTTNNNGGINGGISNGMPIIIKTAVKPTPSISKVQNTINLNTKENDTLVITGRHDPCIVHRARIVIDSVIALGLLDLICMNEAIKAQK